MAMTLGAQAEGIEKWMYSTTGSEGLPTRVEDTDLGYPAPTLARMTISGEERIRLIYGERSGELNAYYWNGSYWLEDTQLNNGLTTVDVGDASDPVLVKGIIGNDWYLIVGRGDGGFSGFRWTGSNWVSNSAITNGLTNIGTKSSPTVGFNMTGEGRWNLIAGRDRTDDAFVGFTWNPNTNEWYEDSKVDWNTGGAAWGGVEPGLVYNYRGNKMWGMLYGRGRWPPYTPATESCFGGKRYNEIGQYWVGDGEVTEGLPFLGDGAHANPSFIFNLTGRQMWWAFIGSNKPTIGIFSYYWYDSRPPVQSRWTPPSNAWVPSTNLQLNLTIDEHGDCHAIVNPPCIPIGAPCMSYEDIKNHADGVDCSGDGTFHISCDLTGLKDWQDTNDTNWVLVGCNDSFKNFDSVGHTKPLYYGVDSTAPIWKFAPWSPFNGSIVPTNENTTLGAESYDLVVTKSWLWTNETCYNQSGCNGKNYTSPPWWNTNWRYRKKITIDNRENVNPAENYSMQIKISTAGLSDIQQDFSDLRFIDLKNNELNYWIEAYEPGKDALLTVRLPKLHAFGLEEIYMYYGNPSAPRVSNVGNTVLHYDDFSNDPFHPDPDLRCGSWWRPGQYCWSDISPPQYIRHTGDSIEWYKRRYDTNYPRLHYSEYWRFKNPWTTDQPYMAFNLTLGELNCDQYWGTGVNFYITNFTGPDREAPEAWDNSTRLGMKIICGNRANHGVPGEGTPDDEHVTISFSVGGPNGGVGGAPAKLIRKDSTHLIEIFVKKDHLYLYINRTLEDKLEISSVGLGETEWTHFLAFNGQQTDTLSAYLYGEIDDLVIKNIIKKEPKTIVSLTEERCCGGGHYGSPHNIYESNKWTVSNFTWLNKTLPSDVAVTWKICYQDIFGRVNCTAARYFTMNNTAPIAHITAQNATAPSPIHHDDSSNPWIIKAGNTLRFNVSATDNENNILTTFGGNLDPVLFYPKSSATFAKNTTIRTVTNESSVTFDFTTAEQGKVFGVGVVVNDSAGKKSNPDYTYVQVGSIVPNQPPEACVINDINCGNLKPYQCTLGGTITLNGSLSRDDEDCPSPGTNCPQPLEYTWKIVNSDCSEPAIPGTLVSGPENTTQLPCDPNELNPGSYRVCLKVNDSEEATGTDSTQLQVLSQLTSANLRIKQVITTPPFQENITANIKILISNYGNRVSDKYNISYTVIDYYTNNIVKIGEEERLPEIVGGVTDETVMQWLPEYPGDYIINITILNNTAIPTRRIMDYKEVGPLRVDEPGTTTGPEYPWAILLLVLIVVPLIAYYSNRTNTEH